MLRSCVKYVGVIGLWLGLSACATPAPKATTRQVLDSVTGATLIVMQPSLVFARERTDVAANARDYLTALVVREDRSGRYTTWLVVYRWSTVDPRFGAASGPSAKPLNIRADDHVLSLHPQASAPASLGSDEFRALLRIDVAPGVYAVDDNQLRSIATSRELVVRYDDDPLPLPYRIWKDARPALTAWLTGMPRS